MSIMEILVEGGATILRTSPVMVANHMVVKKK